MTVLVTGAAGFIGMHVSQLLLARGERVVGVDNLNDYYDPRIKLARLSLLTTHPGFKFVKLDVSDRAAMADVFATKKFNRVVHLAAQVGVRYSLINPNPYIDSNMVGFANVLECCRHHDVQHLVYASSSSVYGGNTTMPFSEQHNVDHPISLYAATKKANELMAHAYSHLFRLPTTGLRFFTVYGPWARPDMALFLFTQAIFAGEPIKVFNHGEMVRDFAYIDDIAEGVVRVLDRPATADTAFDAAAPDPARSNAPYRIFNIGNNSPVRLIEFIEAIERAVGRQAIKEYLPLQQGDLPATQADVSALESWTHLRPATPVREGVNRFVQWYREYFGV